MEHSSWYGGQAQPYPLHEDHDPSAAPVPAPAPAPPDLHNAAEPTLPPPVHYQQPPFETFNPFHPSSSAPMAADAAATSAQNPCPQYDHPLNPNEIPSWLHAPAPVSSHLYGPPPGAGGDGAVRAPDVDAYAPNPYASYAGYDYAAYYGYPPMVGPASGYHPLAGGDAQVYTSAKDAIRQYGVDPGSYGNILSAPPDFSMHQNKAMRPHYGFARKKAKKIGKAVQSAYCKVCKVDCSSQEVLISHRQGKKHKKNLEKLQESIVPKPAKVPATAVGTKEPPKAEVGKTANEPTEENSAQVTTAENKKTQEAEKDKTVRGQNKKKSAPATEMDLETKKRRLLEEGATEGAMRVCTVCNIVCNSEVVFNYHIAGQKHANMVKKQAASAN